jgi:hypothetical protein
MTRPEPSARPRRVSLRSERTPTSSHTLWAYFDDQGALHVNGQDIDPELERFVGKGEAERFMTVRAEHLPLLLELLGAEPGVDVLDFLEEHWSGQASYELVRILYSGAVPVERATI